MPKKKELTFKEKLEKAKTLSLTERCIEVPVDEIEKGTTILAWPLLDCERDELTTYIKDEKLVEYAYILVCYKDSDGNRLFSLDDVPFFRDLGVAFRMKLFTPAFQLSGIGNDYEIVKKQS